MDPESTENNLKGKDHGDIVEEIWNGSHVRSEPLSHYFLSQSMTASAAWRPETMAHWIDATF